MAEIHILNVGAGSCIVFQSNSGRWTMIDICGGNGTDLIREEMLGESSPSTKNYAMCKSLTNPIQYIKEFLGIGTIHRFILTHPDMDHMDGLYNLVNDQDIEITNFWDTGARREPPDFNECARWEEKDWITYNDIINNKIDVKVISPIEGEMNQYFSYNEENKNDIDYLYIYSPDKTILDEFNTNEIDLNDTSYILVYRTCAGRILFTGDSHDRAWECVLPKYKNELRNCEIILAPHHGRDSDRSFNFLDEINPIFGILGCAKAKHLAYNEWNNRNIQKVTQNQVGNIAIYPIQKGDERRLDIYIQNGNFVQDSNAMLTHTDSYGNYFFNSINPDPKY